MGSIYSGIPFCLTQQRNHCAIQGFLYGCWQLRRVACSSMTMSMPVSSMRFLVVASSKSESTTSARQRSVVAPRDVMDLYHDGVRLHKHGKLVEAEKCYRSFLRSEPVHADCLHQLGALLVQKGGNKHYHEALGLVKAAIQLAPANARYRRSLGVVHESGQQWLAAADAFERAVGKQPNDLQAHMHLARVLKRADRNVQAAEVYKAVLKINPNHSQAHYKLAGILKTLGKHEAAADQYREHLKLDPNNVSAAFWLACLTQDTSTAACPASLVAGLFDQYADHFDQHLVHKLQYNTPSVLLGCILEAAAAAVGGQASCQESCGPSQWPRCIDLGCGTGLMGPLLREHVEYVCGVDLSPGMLDKARQRGCYDELIPGDIVEHLQIAQQGGVKPYQLFVAADVFVYMGDLRPVLAAAAALASPRAVMAFSTEVIRCNDCNMADSSPTKQGPAGCSCAKPDAALLAANYQLQVTGRYAHSAHYLRQLAIELGWKVLLMRESIIRYNAGQPIWGNLCVLQHSTH